MPKRQKLKVVCHKFLAYESGKEGRMEFKRVVVSWGGGDKLLEYVYGETNVFVTDSALAAEAVASRHLCGQPKERLFRKATADMWQHCSRMVLGDDWIDPITECLILRGAKHVRPENPGELIGRPMVRTAIRLHRWEASPRYWVAAQQKDEEEKNSERLYQSKEVVVWDGCSASGSTLIALLGLLKKNDLSPLCRILLICPFMGGLALRRVAARAKELRIQLAILCFGVYWVAPIGQGRESETDICIPSDDRIETTHSLAIPYGQIKAHRALFQPVGDGPCLVGDMGESMGGEKEKLGYVGKAIQDWQKFCQTPVPRELLNAKEELEAAVAQLRSTALEENVVGAD
jgi:hypothetical protein